MWWEDRRTAKGVKISGKSGKGCEIKEVLYADDTVLMTRSKEDFKQIVNELGMAWDKMILKS